MLELCDKYFQADIMINILQGITTHLKQIRKYKDPVKTESVSKETEIKINENFRSEKYKNRHTNNEQISCVTEWRE